MSLHLPLRTGNRSQRQRVGGSTLSVANTVWANIDAPRNARDIARHVTLGGLFQAGVPLGFTSDGFLTDGARVSKTAAGSLNLTVSQGFFTRASGATGNNAATTTLGVTTGGANPRIDVVCIDTAGAAFVIVNGTATANANLFNRLGLVADLPANRIPVALVLKGTAANLDADTIVQLR
jgi:hypothetical protein